MLSDFKLTASLLIHAPQNVIQLNMYHPREGQDASRMEWAINPAKALITSQTAIVIETKYLEVHWQQNVHFAGNYSAICTNCARSRRAKCEEMDLSGHHEIRNRMLEPSWSFSEFLISLILIARGGPRDVPLVIAGEHYLSRSPDKIHWFHPD